MDFTNGFMKERAFICVLVLFCHFEKEDNKVCQQFVTTVKIVGVLARKITTHKLHMVNKRPIFINAENF